MNPSLLVSWLRSARVPRWKKLIGVAALAYVVLPFDAIPDLVPVLGWLDDVGVVAAAWAYFSRELRRHEAAAPPSEQVIEGELVAR